MFLSPIPVAIHAYKQTLPYFVRRHRSTSGTTGNPKGALLTHGNFISGGAASESMQTFTAMPDDIHMSFLPLPHIFERLVQARCCSFYSGWSSEGAKEGEQSRGRGGKGGMRRFHDPLLVPKQSHFATNIEYGIALG